MVEKRVGEIFNFWMRKISEGNGEIFECVCCTGENWKFFPFYLEKIHSEKNKGEKENIHL
jgi:hypothetical protein